MLEHGHRRPTHPGLVVLGGASREVHDRPGRSGLTAVVLEPAAKARTSGKGGQRRPAVDGEQPLRHPTGRPEPEAGVHDPADRPPQAAQQQRPGEEVVAHTAAASELALFHHPGPGPGVDLGDPHPGGAHLVAHPAPRAVVDRMVGAGLIPVAETPRLRPLVLGSREEIGDGGHRTGGDADVALDAEVEGGLGGERSPVRGRGRHDGIPWPAASRPAAHPVARAIPSREPSSMGSAPASRLPATKTPSAAATAAPRLTG